jgi:putative transposase
MNRVEERFKELVADICHENDWVIVAMEVIPDHCHLFLNCLPSDSPSDVMAKVKGVTSRRLRQEFQHLSHLPSLWTRSFFVSTAGNVSSETIKRYVEAQKKEGETMPTITLRLELHKPTLPKQQMYQWMTEINTEFANWLLLHPGINKATSLIFKEFSDKKFPSAVVNQTIRATKSQKKNQDAKRFRKMWCCFNNQNLNKHGSIRSSLEQ